MFLRLLGGLSLVAATPASDDLTFIDHPSVRQVLCTEGRGSAFQTDHGWVSVAHVTAMKGCFIDGQPIEVTEQDGEHDFSRLNVFSIRNVPMRIDCSGYKPGEYYWSAGYAFGRPFQTRIRIMATGFSLPDGKRILVGEYSVIPGMSGGPIYNDAGEVVGLVNAFLPGSGISLSRELKDTSLCKEKTDA